MHKSLGISPWPLRQPGRRLILRQKAFYDLHFQVFQDSAVGNSNEGGEAFQYSVKDKAFSSRNVAVQCTCTNNRAQKRGECIRWTPKNVTQYKLCAHSAHSVHTQFVTIFWVSCSWSYVKFPTLSTVGLKGASSKGKKKINDHVFSKYTLVSSCCYYFLCKYYSNKRFLAKLKQCTQVSKAGC